MPSGMPCDDCVHFVSRYVRVDERGGWYEDDCELAYSDNVWADEELDALDRGMCSYFVPRKTDE